MDTEPTDLDVYLAHRAALIDYAAPLVGCRARAEDLVQEAFLRYSTRSGKGGERQPIAHPVAYLYRIVRNLAFDWVRRDDAVVDDGAGHIGRLPATSATPDSRAYGAELSVNYAPSPELELFTDIGLLDTEIEDARDPDLEGKDFARAPHVTTSFGAAYRPTPDWLVSVDARYLGSYFSTDLNNPLAEVDSHIVANARVSWQPIEHLRLFSFVTNIFDSDAETRLFSFPETAPPSLAQLVDPRVFWVGAELRF